MMCLEWVQVIQVLVRIAGLKMFKLDQLNQLGLFFQQILVDISRFVMIVLDHIKNSSHLGVVEQCILQYERKGGLTSDGIS